MASFAFVIHPLDTDHVAKKFSIAKYLPEGVIEKFLRIAPPFKVSSIEGVKNSKREIPGWFIACPLTTQQMVTLPEKTVINKIIQTGKMAEKMGAQLLGLGAFTKVIGDGGITVAKNLNIPVTTGNSYTIATAIEGVKKAANIMGKDLTRAEVVVIGATGAIGKVCAELMARETRSLTLVARNIKELERVANTLLYNTGLSARITSDLKKALAKADIIITVTSAVDTVIEPEDLKPGCIVCDVARPRDVSKRVAQLRDDVLVIEGGLVEVPGDINLNFNFGFPPKLIYACMAETIMLSMEERFESFSLGREITVKQVEDISKIAAKNGFKLAGFRSFEKSISIPDILNIKNKAMTKGKIVNAKPIFANKT
ncbi:MAG: shikimate dehydrogenase [Clostridia bacterium]|nr:shikimate dehydrogenase [Clostridia bacterium]